MWERGKHVTWKGKIQDGEWRHTLFKTSRKRKAITQKSAKLNDGVTKEDKLGVVLIRWHDEETLACTEPVCSQM